MTKINNPVSYNENQTHSVIPAAASMIESFRAIGYTLESAIADLIDNSISAKAKNIWIDYKWDGKDTVIVITDDGYGMTKEDIINAMTLGCRNPLEQREAGDLGRFGLGLKTASFSQTRKFTVLSKIKNGENSQWTWDIDYVNEVKEWKIVDYLPEHELVDKAKSLIESKDQGTAVIWWDTDRLAGGTSKDSKSDLKKFMIHFEKVQKHLSTVFHRFISKSINLYLQGRVLEPWNPFRVSKIGLQPLQEMILPGTTVRIKGYVLPHRTLLSNDEYELGKGAKDSWTEQQGFYVYRDNRLIVYGEWLGLFKKELHYDLCRIAVELPIDMDFKWQLDIKKSTAKPPLILIDALKAYANDVRNIAVEVYRHKGKVIKKNFKDSIYMQVWNEVIKLNERIWKINREHPIIKEAFESSELKSIIERTISLIEETVPIDLMVLRETEGREKQRTPYQNKDNEVLELMNQLVNIFISSGLTKKQAIAKVLRVDPFDNFEHLIPLLEKIND